MDVIDEIKALEHFRELTCSSCSATSRHHCLQIYAVCPQCGTQHKTRSFGAIGTEIHDVIDAVLEWAGEGEEFDAVLRRRDQILADED